MAFLELLDSAKLISRKIWMKEKSWNFHTVLRVLNYRKSKMEKKYSFLAILLASEITKLAICTHF